MHDHPSQRLIIKCLTIIQIDLEFEIVVFEERGKPEYPEKNLPEQGREPATNSATYDAGSGNRTQATLERR